MRMLRDCRRAEPFVLLSYPAGPRSLMMRSLSLPLSVPSASFTAVVVIDSTHATCEPDASCSGPIRKRNCSCLFRFVEHVFSPPLSCFPCPLLRYAPRLPQSVTCATTFMFIVPLSVSSEHRANTICCWCVVFTFHLRATTMDLLWRSWE
jgi:hypothetical protein